MEENNKIELDEMRKQLSLLQEKLDKQDIINEKLIKTSMKNKMSWIKKYVVIELVAIPILIIMLASTYIMLRISFLSYFFIIGLCMLEIYFDYRVNVSSMKAVDYENSNLLQTAEKLVRMKKNRTKQTITGIILAIIWIIWLGIEIYNASAISMSPLYRSMLNGGLVGLVVGGVIGLGIGYYIYRKMQATNDDIIKQIKELTDKGE